MNKALRAAYRAELAQAKRSSDKGDLEAAFASLERAHILGQRHLISHMSTHWRMLSIGIKRGDVKEIAGQLLRLTTTLPGFLSGWIPKGNTGGANVSAFKPMPIPDDLQLYLRDFSVWRDVGIRAMLLTVVLSAALGTLAWADFRRGKEASELEQLWQQTPTVKVADFGTTAKLEVIPLVNWHASAKGLRTEPGVSYLIKTDKHTILFDVGFNREQEDPSPLEHNMGVLGIKLDAIDTIFISHAHRDHLGGTHWEKSASFSLGKHQSGLDGKRMFAPVPLNYPGARVETISQARALLPGIASTGPIPRRLLLGRIDEQALIINVKGRGLVAIVGCGHQTVPKLIRHIRASFSEPLIGIIGDVHYPMPEGRLNVLGIDAQRWLASGDGVWKPITREQVAAEIALMNKHLEFVALGAHDTSDEALAMFAQAFQGRFQKAIVGSPISVAGKSDQ